MALIPGVKRVRSCLDGAPCDHSIVNGATCDAVSGRFSDQVQVGIAVKGDKPETSVDVFEKCNCLLRRYAMRRWNASERGVNFGETMRGAGCDVWSTTLVEAQAVVVVRVIGKEDGE